MVTRTSFVISIVVAILALVVPIGAQKRIAPVRLFITSIGAANGFTDPNKGNQDTMQDLRADLKNYKTLALTDTRDQATIVLVVMDREKAQSTVGFGIGRDCTVRVKFIFNDLETEMSGSAMGGRIASEGA
jgi:hypothetical protein